MTQPNRPPGNPARFKATICSWSAIVAITGSGVSGSNSAELASVSLQASSYAQIVNVYQAMGGGWVDIATRMAPQPQGGRSPVQSQAFNAGFGNLGTMK